MKTLAPLTFFFFMTSVALAQIQVGLKFKRLQYIAHEPIVAKLTITNLAGRDIDLHDENGQHWFGFEVTAGEGRTIAPLASNLSEPALKVEAGKTVTRDVNLTPVFPVHDLGNYHVRANVYFADLNKFFYSAPKVFEVSDARPIWQKTVGIPEGMPGAGDVRTYSLLSNRFPDHTSLYVRVENKNNGVVYATYSLGHIIVFDQPQAELDRANQLHVLHCAAPRTWSYAHIGLNGERLAQSTLMEAKAPPRLRLLADGSVAIHGGVSQTQLAQTARSSIPKLSGRPSEMPKED